MAAAVEYKEINQEEDVEVEERDFSKAQRVHLAILEAKDLTKSDILGKADPYLKVSLGNDPNKTAQTAAKKKTLNPEFGVSFEWIRFTNEEADNVLTVQVWDKDRFTSDDLIGTVHVKLDTLEAVPFEFGDATESLLHVVQEGTHDKWFPLTNAKHEPSGEIHVRIRLVDPKPPAPEASEASG